jgi:hypothetical protein
MNKTLARLTLGVAAGVAGMVGALPPASAQGGNDAKGPDCAEIVDGRGAYAFGTTPGTRVVTADLTLLAPACADITYTFVVTYTTLTGTAARVVTTSYELVGTVVSFTVAIPEVDAPAQVQTAVTTTKRGKLLDETSTPLDFDILPGSGGGSYQG